MHIVYVFFILFVLVAIGRLFYLQIIKHDYYKSQANASQFRSSDIPAESGQILFENNGELLPLVLNERTYTVVSDPLIISDKDATATKLSEILGKDKGEIYDALDDDTVRYQVLARGVNADVKDAVELAMREGEIEATFAETTSKRVYPYETLASTTLGFVDDEREGRYGLEQALNEELSGTPGRVKALTDQNGIPLLASDQNNILEDPIDGQDTVLTLDIAMQRQLETLLKQGLDNAQSESGSAIIMDPNTGAIKAIANYPSYDPAALRDVEDSEIFQSPAVSAPLEPGSVVKPLTAAAALDNGSVLADQSYFDPSFYVIDGATVRNIAEDGGAAQRSVSDILRFSLNTGATWLLMQMGGGELNETGRVVWHDYMTKHYRFGQTTGIEQGYEAPGNVPSPTDGFGLDIQYANTSFGQGVTITPLQLASATASIVNGGTYYQPTLVSGYLDEDDSFVSQEPRVLENDVVSSETSATLVDFMQTVVRGNSVTAGAARDGYIVGGKTGTAEIPNPEGGYFEDRFNGTYSGFVGGDRPEYVIFVRVNDPKIPGYAGSQAAGPIFTSVVDMLIDNFSVPAISG